MKPKMKERVREIHDQVQDHGDVRPILDNVAGELSALWENIDCINAKLDKVTDFERVSGAHDPKYYVQGPDGITVLPHGGYNTITEAAQAMVNFVLRYRQQGYYRDAHGRRIALENLAAHCFITTTEIGEPHDAI